MPKFLTFRGCFSWICGWRSVSNAAHLHLLTELPTRKRKGREPRTSFRETISPVAFLTFLRPRKKYQYRDFATEVLGAKMVMR